MYIKLKQNAALRLVLLGALVNVALAIVKFAAGVLGDSFALIADGLESSADVVSSLVVLTGLFVALLPADDNHPYGHGKAEALAAMAVSLALIVAAVVIAKESIYHIAHPHKMPEAFTLVVLVVVIAVKEFMFRKVIVQGQQDGSTAMQADAWHHRSDALTSLAAFIGISVALIGGQAYASADDWAALLACGVIAFNGILLFKSSLHEIMDGNPQLANFSDLQQVAAAVPGVCLVEKFRLRKVGLNLVADLHVQVAAELSIQQGHDIAHAVKRELIKQEPKFSDITIHIEPFAVTSKQACGNNASC